VQIEEIEGVGPAYAAKLCGAGVLTTEQLLERGASASSRQGVGSEYADLPRPQALPKIVTH
jgi:predicted flap endonuclease-1-like 5' DNA nuclease